MPKAYPQHRERHGIRYTLLDAPRPDRARFAFEGPFQGQETRWDTTLQTTPGIPYIDIGGETAAGRRLTVALAIPGIDEPAILRTIIMIRQYKRLRPGRHEFGVPAA